MRTDWRRLLGRGRWKMVSNLPYNVAVPLILSMLERHLPIDTYLVMVQKEVGERLAAAPGDDAYGAPSVRVAYHAQAKVLRRIPPTVFWPQPNVESVLVRIEPRERPPVDVRADALFRIVDEGFGQRRKTMRNALRRLGLTAADASEVLTGCGLAAGVRAESLGVADFACIARALEGKGLGG